MRRTLTLTILAVAAVMGVFAWLTCGCSLKWTNPFENEADLEQTGKAINCTAQTAIIVAYQNEPGEWATHVCSTATIILAALDGDSQAIQTVNAMLSTMSPDYRPVYITDMDKKMSLELRNLLLCLLRYSAEMWDMRGWDAAIAAAIGIADAFLSPEVITDYAVWYLTRELIAGIVEGCADCGVGQ